MKFGGTSVKDDTAIKRVINIIKNKSGKKLIVVSAFSSVTDKLVNIIKYLNELKPQNALSIVEELRNRHLDTAKSLGVLKETSDIINISFNELERLISAIDIIGEVTKRSEDYILSMGERLSSLIIYHYANLEDISISHLDSRELIKTKQEDKENILLKDVSENLINENVNPLFNKFENIICGGFISSNLEGITTTLGRGGSDYTAAIYSAALNATKLEIWTDVDGILTSDPRMVKGTKLIKAVSYVEASELAYFGAKVLHPKTIYPAIEQEIPVFVLNTFKPDSTGTRIVSKQLFNSVIKAIAFRKSITVINIHSNRMLGAYGFLSEVFEIFKKYQTSVDLITTSEVSISLTIDDDSNLENILNDLNKFSKTEVYPNRSIISAVGEGIRHTAGIAARFFGVLKGINVSMVSLGASEVNLGVVVNDEDLERAVLLLHQEFFNENCSKDIFEDIN